MMKFVLALTLMVTMLSISIDAVVIGPTAYPVTSRATDFSTTVSVAKFNSNLGTLTQIDIVGTGAVTTTITVTNSAAAASDGTVRTVYGLQFDTPLGNTPFFPTDTLSVGGLPQDVDVEALTNTQTYTLAAGASQTLTQVSKTAPAISVTVTSTTATDSNSNTYSSSAFFAEMQAGGGGTILITIASITQTSLTNNGGNTAASQVSTGTAGLSVTYIYTAAVTGDPQIVGFQGQHFQIHGTPDEHYNLISTADYYLNSRFEYMATGVCNYNDTECFSHPGTYIGEIGLVRGDYRVKVTSGPHASGLSVHINDRSAPAGTRVKISNDTSVHVVSANRVILTTEDFTMTAVNSDLFLNLGVDFVNSRMLHAGHQQVVIPGSASASDAEKLIATTYPEFAMHGLLGQTWRNIKWPQHRLYQGEPSDYQVSSLFSPNFLYTQYQA
jgi:hypothetical protein